MRIGLLRKYTTAEARSVSQFSGNTAEPPPRYSKQEAMLAAIVLDNRLPPTRE